MPTPTVVFVFDRKARTAAFAGLFLAAALLLSQPFAAAAQTNITKGQHELAGGDGQFGVVYSMKDGFNDEILGGYYTIEPMIAYSGLLSPNAGQKLLVVDVAMKNATPKPNETTGWDITAFDQNGVSYTGKTELKSDGTAGFDHTLNPGQGLGLIPSNPLMILYTLPSNARIVKLIINEPRLYSHDQVFRYYIAGATAAEAGKAGDPKNIIKPLPAYVQDTSDPSGALAIDPGHGGKPGSGTTLYSGPFSTTLLSFGDAPAGSVYSGNPPDDGKKYVVATMTVHNIGTLGDEIMDFYTTMQLTDTDGNTYDLKGLQEADKDQVIPNFNIVAPDQTLTVRVFWMVPADATIPKLEWAGGSGRLWDFDLTP